MRLKWIFNLHTAFGRPISFVDAIDQFGSQSWLTFVLVFRFRNLNDQHKIAGRRSHIDWAKISTDSTWYIVPFKRVFSRDYHFSWIAARNMCFKNKLLCPTLYCINLENLVLRFRLCSVLASNYVQYMRDKNRRDFNTKTMFSELN